MKYILLFIIIGIVILISILCVFLFKKNTPLHLIPYRTISKRTQWGGNYGYCGEISFITAAMYYGMYMSQYDVRRLTSPTGTQKNYIDQVVLDNQSAIDAADLFQFTYERWMDSSSYELNTSSFIKWVSLHTSTSQPVFIGVYDNNELQDTPNIGDPIYDHIVSVIECSSTRYTFSDNGLGTGKPDVTNLSSNEINMYTYTFPINIRNRIQSFTTPSLYSLPTGVMNYGFAITGMTSLEPLLIRIQLTTDTQEYISIIDGSDTRPAPVPMNLTVYLYNIKPNVTYYLYRYNDPTHVPIQNYNQSYNTNPTSAIKREIRYPIKTPVITLVDQIMSNDIAFYRCVPSYAS